MRRRLNRFGIETPPADVLQAYLRTYLLEDLYDRPESLTPISSEGFFGNAHPLTLDIGCGRGEYIVREAAMHPERNYIGVDFHLKSLYDGITQAAAQKLENVRFIKTDARWVMRAVPDGSVDELLLLFPPPVRRPKFFKKDLITLPRLQEYHRGLHDRGTIRFVTDVRWYFESRIETIAECGLFHETHIGTSMEGGVTWYQRIWEQHGLPSLRAEYAKHPTLRSGAPVTDGHPFSG